MKIKIIKKKVKKLVKAKPKPGVTIRAWVASSCCWICC